MTYVGHHNMHIKAIQIDSLTKPSLFLWILFHLELGWNLVPDETEFTQPVMLSFIATYSYYTAVLMKLNYICNYYAHHYAHELSHEQYLCFI